MTEHPLSRRRLALVILAIVVPSLDTINLESGKRTAIGDPVFGDDQFKGVRVHPEGDKLTFEITEGPKGQSATNINRV